MLSEQKNIDRDMGVKNKVEQTGENGELPLGIFRAQVDVVKDAERRSLCVAKIC